MIKWAIVFGAIIAAAFPAACVQKQADTAGTQSADTAKTQPASTAGTQPAVDAAKVEWSDKAVSSAVWRGVAFLKKARKQDGSFEPYAADKSYEIGPAALALLALLETGENPLGKDMAVSIKWLSGQVDKRIAASLNPADGSKDPLAKTYEMGLACLVYQSAGRCTGRTYGPVLDKVASLLFKYSNHGGYTYDIVKRPGPAAAWPLTYDNSNSFYGLLGVWAAELGVERGITTVEIPREYWWKVMKHWLDCQNADGGWGYSDVAGKSTPTMTAAGLASMRVCYDNYFTTVSDLTKPGAQNTEFKSLQRGLDWLDKNFKASLKDHPGSLGYYCYIIQQVGLANGYKYFGTSDWYKELGELLLAEQKADGSWGDVVDTSFAVLFLSHGQKMVLFNKLQYDGDWHNRPRDLAKLTEWLGSNNCMDGITWQIINIKVPVSQWHDAPMLYISGSTAPKFMDEDGGTLIVEAAGGNSDFAETGGQLKSELYGAKPQLLIAANSPIFRVKGYELEKARYRTQTRGRLKDKFNLVAMELNGRPAIIFSAEDLTAGLVGYACLGVDGYSPGTADEPGMAYQLMRNIILYCANLDATTATQPAEPSPFPPKKIGQGTGVGLSNLPGLTFLAPIDIMELLLPTKPDTSKTWPVTLSYSSLGNLYVCQP